MTVFYNVPFRIPSSLSVGGIVDNQMGKRETVRDRRHELGKRQRTE